MSETLRLCRGTATQVASYTGPSGEVVVDTTNNRLVVQDGMTEGGWPIASAAALSSLLATFFTSLPTTEPATAGVVWNNNGVISIS